MKDFEFCSTLTSMKAYTCSASSVIFTLATYVTYEIENNASILLVPFVLIIMDSILSVVRVSMLRQGGFESSKFKKSIGKLIIYYVAIISGWTIDLLIRDAGISIIGEHPISWAVCAFLSVGEVVSILASVVVIFPDNVLSKLILRVFIAEVSAKLEKWGIDEGSLREEVDALIDRKKKKYSKTLQKKQTKIKG